jgi:hypothetical protein
MAAKKKAKPKPQPVVKPNPSPLPGEIADLLSRSMAAHLASKQRGGRNLTRLAEAYDLRKQAIAADPARVDPAWAAEQGRTTAQSDTHTELMMFYRETLD